MTSIAYAQIPYVTPTFEQIDSAGQRTYLPVTLPLAQRFSEHDPCTPLDVRPMHDNLRLPHH